MSVTTIKQIAQEEWDYYLSLNRDYSPDIEYILENALIREVTFNINVPEYIYPDVFSDLEYAVIMIRKYTRYGFLMTNEGEGYYSCHDGLYTFATIDHIYTNEDRNKYLYYIEGDYLGKLRLVGRMILYLEFYEKNGLTYFKAKAFVFIQNLLLRKAAKVVLKFSAFRKRIDRMIDGSIRNILGAGLKASYRIHQDDYTYDKYLNNYSILHKRYMVPKKRKKK